MEEGGVETEETQCSSPSSPNEREPKTPEREEAFL